MPSSQAIHIQKPEQQGTIWLAFSEHKWSDKTFDEMENDDALRDRRMQTLNTRNWVDNHYCSHGVVATQAHIEHILEYSNNSDEHGKISGDLSVDISQTHAGKTIDGHYDKDQLKQYATLHHSNMRLGASAKLAKHLQPDPQSPQNQPLLFALWDRVGVLHEVNGYRNDATAQLSRYKDERALEIEAMQILDFAQNQIQQHIHTEFENNLDIIEARVRGTQQIIMSEDDFLLSMQNPDYNALKANLPEGSTSRLLPLPQTRDRYGPGRQMVEVILPAHDPRRQALDSTIERLRDHHSRDRNQRITQRMATNWEEYTDEFDPAHLNRFRQQFEQLQQDVQQLLDERTEAVIAVLQSPKLVDALVEYHTEDLIDGLFYAHVIGQGIDGLGSSPAGKAFLSAWVSEASTDESNLFWRAMALNQTQASDSLAPALALYSTHQAKPLTSHTIASTIGVAVMLEKFADVHSKALGLMHDKTLPQTGLAKIINSVGLALYHPLLKGGIDPAANHIMNMVVCAQHQVDLAQVHEDTRRRLMKKEARIKQRITKKQNKQQWHKAGQDALAWRDDKSEQWKGKKWNKYQQKIWAADAKIEQLLKDQEKLAQQHDLAQQKIGVTLNERTAATQQHITKTLSEAEKTNAVHNYASTRFAMVVALMQAWGFMSALKQLDSDDENNPIFIAKAMVAGIALIGTSAEVYANLMEIAGNKKINSAPNSKILKLKALGASLGAVATGVQSYFDFMEMGKQFKQNKIDLGVTYAFKTLGNTVLTIGMMLSTLGIIEKPLAQAAGRRAGLTLLSNISARAAASTFLRLFVFWLGIASIGIEIIIWLMTDSDLENWCERCAFSKVRGKPANPRQARNFKKGQSIHPRYKTVAEQREAFEKAAIAVI